MTVKKLIKRSMRVAGIISAGETPPADEINDALDSLNDIIASWNSTGDGLVSEPVISIQIVAGEHEYHIGITDPGGVQFVTAERPEQVKNGFWRVDGVDTPLERYSFKKYDEIRDKSRQGTPCAFHYDATSPIGVVRLYPVPNITGTVILRITATPLATITNVNTPLESLFTKQQAVALKWTLAAELCPEYGRQVPQMVYAMAKAARKGMEEIIFSRSITPRDLNQTSQGNIYNQ